MCEYVCVNICALSWLSVLMCICVYEYTCTTVAVCVVHICVYEYICTTVAVCAWVEARRGCRSPQRQSHSPLQTT